MAASTRLRQHLPPPLPRKGEPAGRRRQAHRRPEGPPGELLLLPLQEEVAALLGGCCWAAPAAAAALGLWWQWPQRRQEQGEEGRLLRLALWRLGAARQLSFSGRAEAASSASMAPAPASLRSSPRQQPSLQTPAANEQARAGEDGDNAVHNSRAERVSNARAQLFGSKTQGARSALSAGPCASSLLLLRTPPPTNQRAAAHGGWWRSPSSSCSSIEPYQAALLLKHPSRHQPAREGVATTNWLKSPSKKHIRRPAATRPARLSAPELDGPRRHRASSNADGHVRLFPALLSLPRRKHHRAPAVVDGAWTIGDKQRACPSRVAQRSMRAGEALRRSTGQRQGDRGPTANKSTFWLRRSVQKQRSYAHSVGCCAVSRLVGRTVVLLS